MMMELEFVFFKEKTENEVAACLVGSEMGIRSRHQRIRMRAKEAFGKLPASELNGTFPSCLDYPKAGSLPCAWTKSFHPRCSRLIKHATLPRLVGRPNNCATA